MTPKTHNSLITSSLWWWLWCPLVLLLLLLQPTVLLSFSYESFSSLSSSSSKFGLGSRKLHFRTAQKPAHPTRKVTYNNNNIGDDLYPLLQKKKKKNSYLKFTAASNGNNNKNDNTMNNNDNDHDDIKSTSSTTGTTITTTTTSTTTNPWYYQIPNILTISRCFAIPILVGTFYYMPKQHFYYSSSFIFAIASLTDLMDGYLARRWNVITSFGTFLDPVADKIMVSTALILLCSRYGSGNGILFSIPTVLILARELSISALREWMAQCNLRQLVAVGFQGKLKTAFTMISITILLSVPSSIGFTVLSSSLSSPIWNVSNLSSLLSSLSLSQLFWARLFLLGILFLYVSTLFTLTSAMVYFKAAMPILLPSAQKPKRE